VIRENVNIGLTAAGGASTMISAGRSADINHRFWRDVTQQQAQIARAQGHAALGGRPVRAHQMDEDGAASALDARSIIVIYFRNDII